MAKNDKDKVTQYIDESTTTKYMINAKFTIEGVVEKPDVVGALFGQTEGLLSDDLDLRELQKGGRVGRIQVRLSVRSGRTRGNLQVPSSLDKVETSILAAAIETVDRIGPCNAKINIIGIEDVREEKRKKIIERASDLLKRWDSVSTQESTEIHDEVIRAARVGGITTYGHLPAGPELNDSDTIIVVEGRADIAACLRSGVRNTIAVEGTSVPKAVSDLTRRKTTIAFLDGDRGGDLILKELLMYGFIDFVARAPTGKEVEDLKPKEIIEQLSKKVPIEKANFISEIHAHGILENAIKKKQSKYPKTQKPIEQVKAKVSPTPQKQPVTAQAQSSKQSTTKTSRPSSSSRRTSSRPSSRRSQSSSRGRRSSRPTRRAPPKIPDEYMGFVKDVDGKEKQEGLLLDDNQKEIKRAETKNLYDEIQKEKKKINAVVFDGVITQRLIDLCEDKDIETVIGARVADLERKRRKVRYYTFS